jgi:hypothetical protein
MDAGHCQLSCYQLRKWSQLTEDSSWRIVTGETGLAHTRAAKRVSMLFSIASYSCIAFAIGRVSAERRLAMAVDRRHEEGSPIVNDQCCNLFCESQSS